MLKVELHSIDAGHNSIFVSFCNMGGELLTALQQKRKGARNSDAFSSKISKN